MNKTVFIITFLFLNQTLWSDPNWNRLSETIPMPSINKVFIIIIIIIIMSGNIIRFGWEIRKLAFWKLPILDLICCPVSIVDRGMQYGTRATTEGLQAPTRPAVLHLLWGRQKSRAGARSRVPRNLETARVNKLF